MYVYDSINTVYVRLCTLMTIVMSFTVSDSHKPNSELDHGTNDTIGSANMLFLYALAFLVVADAILGHTHCFRKNILALLLMLVIVYLLPF